MLKDNTFVSSYQHGLVTESYYETQVVADAGHSANEPGIAAELVAANEKLKNILRNKGD